MEIWGQQTDMGLTADDMRDAVDRHLAHHIGAFETAFTDEEGWAGESREDGPPVDVLVVPPVGERRFAYVSSFGCAFNSLPAESYGVDSLHRRVEFVLAAQQTDDDDANLTSLNLAANTVRQFAKLVHLNAITVEPGETVSFSEEPRPVFENADFCAFAFIKPRLPGPGFDKMKLAEAETDEDVRYVSPIPIHKSELQYSIEMGPQALAQLLMDNGETEMIDLNRQSVVQASQKTVATSQIESEPDAKPDLEAEMEEATLATYNEMEEIVAHDDRPQRKSGFWNFLLSLIGIR